MTVAKWEVGLMWGLEERERREKDGFGEERERRVVKGVLGKMGFGIVVLVSDRFEDVRAAIDGCCKVFAGV